MTKNEGLLHGVEKLSVEDIRSMPSRMVWTESDRELQRLFED